MAYRERLGTWVPGGRRSRVLPKHGVLSAREELTEREILHGLLEECDALINPEQYPSLHARIAAVLADCVDGCVPLSRSRLRRINVQLKPTGYSL